MKRKGPGVFGWIRALLRDRFIRLLLLILIPALVWWALQVPSCSLKGGERIGRVQHEELTEISGIAVSRQNRDVLWAHNDSGDSARVFAMKTDGTHLGIFGLADAFALDYEDMAIGPGPESGVDYLFIADTGNNNLTRNRVTVYRVPEPKLPADGTPVETRLTDVVALPMTFPDTIQECETLLVDPLNGDLYLITRDRGAKQGGMSIIYRNSAPHEPGVIRTLEEVARLRAPNEIKGGDFSPDGSLILLRAHSEVRRVKALQWTWDRKQSLKSLFSKPGNEVPTASERQGEAIAFSPDGKSYFTIGEDANAPIYRYDTVRQSTAE